MKTFEEACRVTIIREEPRATANDQRMLRDIQTALDKRADILRQVQASPEATMLVIAIHQLNQQGASLSDCIRTAFANGVIVGMEMERSDEQMPNL